MFDIKDCVNHGFPIRNPKNIKQFYKSGNKKIPAFVKTVDVDNFVLLCDDFITMVKNKFENVLSRTGANYLYTRNLITGASVEDFALQSCFCYRPLSSKFYSPASHDPGGDIKCSDGYIGCKTTTTRDENKVEISMYRTNSIPCIKNKISHVSECYTGMKRDIIWIKTIDKDKRMKKMRVLFCIPSKIKELNPKNYKFKKKGVNQVSNVINKCFFKIKSSTSSQFWWHCEDVNGFIDRYKKKGVITELDVNIEKFDNDFIPKLSRNG